MRLSIKLYSTNQALVSPEVVSACIGLFGLEGVKVSRTLGPANYYEINRRSLNGEDVVFPGKDISFQTYNDVGTICGLLRPGSVLTVSYWGKTEHVAEITHAISAYSPGTTNFFSSSSGYSFGPVDIFDLFDNENGQEDVRLVDVAQFCFVISSDNFLGDLDALRESLSNVEAFVRLRSNLERIVGPLILRIEV